MLRKAEIITDVVLDASVSNSAFKPAVSKRVNDEVCLEAMRSIVKDYIAHRQEHPEDKDAKLSFKSHYEEYRQQINDNDLKSYTAFELMENLYWQEYLSRK